MTQFVKGVVLLAAALFIGVSAGMNAAFLSSFGRTELETSLLLGVSLAGDGVKAVLPVVVMRALAVRTWVHAALASLMLAVLLALSLASGLGFAAVTRGSAIVAREFGASSLAVLERDLAENERRMAALNAARSIGEVETALDAARIDRNWQASKSCSETGGPSLRQFCTGIFALRGELATAREREALLMQRQTMRAEIARLRVAGAGADSDPQASALAEMLGTDRKMPRLILTSALAVILELGSLVLILLATGPAVRGWREPGTEPKPAVVEAVLPPSVDRAHWQRQRRGDILGDTRGSGNARQG